MARVRAHVFITGRVQGVWFRESTRRRASELELQGWVKNVPDGRVEAEFVGTPEAVEAALRFVAEGPEHARVDSVSGGNLEPTDDDTTGEAFRIL